MTGLLAAILGCVVLAVVVILATVRIHCGEDCPFCEGPRR